MYSDFHTTYSIFIILYILIPSFLAQSVFFMCDKPAAVRWSTIYLLPNVAFLLEKHLAHFNVQMCSPSFGLEWQHPDTDRQKKKIIPPLEKVKLHHASVYTWQDTPHWNRMRSYIVLGPQTPRLPHPEGIPQEALTHCFPPPLLWFHTSLAVNGSVAMLNSCLMWWFKLVTV